MFTFLEDFWPKKWPSKNQWKRFLEVMSVKEKIVFFFLVVLTTFSFFYTLFALYNEKTVLAPSSGGVYREGFIQTINWLTINPLYASQSEVERDIVEVFFDSLMRYNKDGDIVSNLAEGYTTEDGRIYDLTLRDDIYWSDGEEITAEDVVFTVRTILNPDYQSPLRSQWVGVEVERLSEKEVRFTLESPSSIFPENLTLKVIPKHIFKDDSPRDFRYSVYNMKPVGSGPYRFKEIKESISGDIEFIRLERNPHYFNSNPYLDEVSFHFFRDDEELIRAQRRGEIDGFLLPESMKKDFPSEKLRNFSRLNFSFPRYFSALFNLRSEGAVGNLSVREALKYATNKEELFEEVLMEEDQLINSPLALELYKNMESQATHTFDQDKAIKILEEEGFKNGKKAPDDRFSFTKDLKEDSQGEEVRRLQRCFLHLQEEDEDIYPEGEVTGFFSEETKEAVNYFQEKYREEILDPHNFSKGTGMVAKSTRKKLNELCENLFNEGVSLEISITTISDPTLLKTAHILKRQWEEVGVSVLIEEKSATEIKEEVIRPRDFDVLLFGTMLTGIINPLPLWHSSKIDDPALNLSGYSDDDSDALLEAIITENDVDEKMDNLLNLEEKLLENVPGIFLYNPKLVYYVSEKINGIEEGFLANSSRRFKDIDKWHINSRRTIRR